jgi:hypothetical protein
VQPSLQQRWFGGRSDLGPAIHRGLSSLRYCHSNC